MRKFLVPVAAALLMAPISAFSDDDTPEYTTDIWDIARGGQLYDNWMSVLDADAPEGTHPAYPAAAKKSGATTWRCKECHGWDYVGKDGAYSSGSHYTGIVGVRGSMDMSEDSITTLLTNRTHGFSLDQLPANSISKLAKFLKFGQLNTDLYIDRKTKVAKGDAANGARLYQTICAVCHGFDGTDLNFGSSDDPEYVGTVAAGNPWEALHKIRFGQPGVGMIALTALDTQTLVDILAYTQTLPTK